MHGRGFTSLGMFAALPNSAMAFSQAISQRKIELQARLRDLEATAGRRLGVQVVDSATGQEFGHRPDELFVMLSSFKLLASALDCTGWTWAGRRWKGASPSQPKT